MEIIEAYLSQKPIVVENNSAILVVLSPYPNNKEHEEKKMFICTGMNYLVLKEIELFDKIKVFYERSARQNQFAFFHQDYERQHVASVNVLFKNNHEKNKKNNIDNIEDIQ